MSKSVEGSFINLTDSLTQIKGKIAKVPTDSGKGKSVPKEGGVATLMQFVELFEGEEKRKEYEKMYVNEGIKYSDLKRGLASSIYRQLKPIQEKRAKLEKEKAYVDSVIEQGAKKASKIASGVLSEVKRKMGVI